MRACTILPASVSRYKSSLPLPDPSCLVATHSLSLRRAPPHPSPPLPSPAVATRIPPPIFLFCRRKSASCDSTFQFCPECLSYDDRTLTNPKFLFFLRFGPVFLHDAQRNRFTPLLPYAPPHAYDSYNDPESYTTISDSKAQRRASILNRRNDRWRLPSPLRFLRPRDLLWLPPHPQQPMEQKIFLPVRSVPV